jgi:hypothetical protein
MLPENRRLGMATELHLKHTSGLGKVAFVGWSWTSFFCGGFPALFRGDLLGFFVWLIVAVALGFFTMFIGNVIFWFVWAGIYNRWHARRLIERGYQIVGGVSPLDMARVMG